MGRGDGDRVMMGCGFGGAGCALAREYVFLAIINRNAVTERMSEEGGCGRVLSGKSSNGLGVRKIYAICGR